MPEAPQSNPVELPTPSDPPLNNSPDARNPDGSLKDQTPPTPNTNPDSNQNTPPENKDGKKDGDDPQGAPETYADFKVPDGVKLAEGTNELFKELNLSQDAAQKLVDHYLTKAGPDAFETAFNTIREGWRNEVLADKDHATGGKLKPEVSQTISRAIDAIGDKSLADEFRNVMNTTGVGDNPTFVRAFYALAKQVTEGTHVTGKGPSPFGQTPSGQVQRPSAAKALFPNNP